MQSTTTIITESKRKSFLSAFILTASTPRKMNSSSLSRSDSKQTTNFNFNFNFNFVRLMILAISISSTCSAMAQDIINTNTVMKAAGKLESAKFPAAVRMQSGAIISGASININSTSSAVITKSKNSESLIKKKIVEYDCPKKNLAGLPLIFSIPCKINADCSFLGSDQRCCKNICRKGILAAPKEPQHRAVLGLNRMCPKEPVPEILPVKNCLTDFDCEEERRVCCPDKDLKLYCRTAAPVWSQLPFPRTHEPLMSLIEYMQCQKAPPQLLDLFSQPCNRTLDCLPNLCCQEGPNKFCRPAKKSVLSLVAQATQRFARG